jgi:hypothetical protein
MQKDRPPHRHTVSVLRTLHKRSYSFGTSLCLKYFSSDFNLVNMRLFNHFICSFNASEWLYYEGFWRWCDAFRRILLLDIGRWIKSKSKILPSERSSLMFNPDGALDYWYVWNTAARVLNNISHSSPGKGNRARRTSETSGQVETDLHALSAFPVYQRKYRALATQQSGRVTAVAS